jgi:DNA-binding IclR family transcriptional regulator
MVKGKNKANARKGGSLAGIDWKRIFLPCMRLACNQLGQTVSLATLRPETPSGLLVASVRPAARFCITLNEGWTFDLHANAPGKVILAYLPDTERDDILRRMAFTPHTAATVASLDAFNKELADIRRRGYAFDREEDVEGIRCLAIPVFAAGHRIAASIFMTGLSSCLPYEKLESDYPLFRAAADGGERALARSQRGSALTRAADAKMSDKIDTLMARLANPPFDTAPDFNATAASLGMSYSSFRHFFRQRAGTSPAHYWNERRMAFAAHELAETSATIQQIAERCGFATPAYFTAAFTRSKGVSPTAFREHACFSAKR